MLLMQRNRLRVFTVIIIFLGIILEDMELSPSQTYYSTLTVCNAGGLCHTAPSDGVQPDPSSPHAGIVMDGLGPDDVDFIISRLVISDHNVLNYATYIYICVILDMPIMALI